MMWQCHLSSSECRCYRLNGFSLFKRLPIPLSSGSRTLEQSVGEWLEAVGLQQYESKLLLNGFDDVRFLVSAPRPVSLSPCWTWKLYVVHSPGEELKQLCFQAVSPVSATILTLSPLAAPVGLPIIGLFP